jgi:predicted exporter
VTRAVRLWLWAICLVGLVLYSGHDLSFATDITNFVPDGTSSELAHVSRELAHSDLARTMVLTIGGGDPERRVAAAKQVAATLRAHPEVEWLRDGPDEDLQRRVYELYFPRRFYFASAAPERELPARLADDGLRAAAEAARAQLALPISPLLERTLPEDPLGAFQAVLLRLQGGEPPLATQGGSFVTRDGEWAVILLATRHSAFDTTAQRPLLAAVASAFAEANARHGGDLVLEQSGANRFALDAEQQIRGDASLISTLSTVGVALLSLLFFRSLLSLGIVVVPGLAGLAIAMTAGFAIFGRLDGMTIAFGASLIGVTIDYPTHLLVLWSLSDARETPWSLARRLALPVTLAALTTVVSFAALGFTSSRGFRELGLFAAIGVAGALATSLLLLPDLLPRKRRVLPVSAGLARRIGPWVTSLRARRGVLGASVALVLAVGAVALPRLDWNDDLSNVASPDPRLFAEDQRVRERVSNFESGRFVIVLSDDADDAIARNERVYERLSRLVASGEIGGVRSLHALLWPEDLQRRNLAALRADPTLPARLEAAFASSGFRAGSFAPFARALAASPPPLTLEELTGSELAPLAASFVVRLDERLGVITYLRDVRDPDAVRSAVEDLPGVHFFEQRRFIDTVFASFRSETLRLIVLGSLAVFALLLVHYREWRRATAAVLPSVLVPIVVLSGFALAGAEVNLLHAVSLLMVMGMGVDYGIFIIDEIDQRGEFGPTLVSCLLCCLTTILSFGALAISSHPALRAIGIAAGAGIALALVLAPASLLLVRSIPEESSGA